MGRGRSSWGGHSVPLSLGLPLGPRTEMGGRERRREGGPGSLPGPSVECGVQRVIWLQAAGVAGRGRAGGQVCPGWNFVEAEAVCGGRSSPSTPSQPSTAAQRLSGAAGA